MTTYSAFGRLINPPHQVYELSALEDVSKLIKTTAPGIAYGMGRSYGDSCLNAKGVLWSTQKLDRFLHFDENTLRLTCEAGVLLKDIQHLFLPRGLMLPVTPGTGFVTVGGAIANDVHGKNHVLKGSFGHHVLSIRLMRTDGSVFTCMPKDFQSLFRATIGGLGLTGVIVSSELQLQPIKSTFMEIQNFPFYDLETCFKQFEKEGKDWEHVSAWIDGSAFKKVRGLLMCGRFITTQKTYHQQKKSYCVPKFPCKLVYPWSSFAFNSAYFYYHLHKHPEVVDCRNVLYPLDTLLQWNRLYGTKGFYQYQSVFPMQNSFTAITQMFEIMREEKQFSPLVVLKRFGNLSSPGFLSFPKEGMTISLDFPNVGETLERLFKRFDNVVSAKNGRIYMAKDARMPRAIFEETYPNIKEFLKYRDLGTTSMLSRRLFGS